MVKLNSKLDIPLNFASLHCRGANSFWRPKGTKAFFNP